MEEEKKSVIEKSVIEEAIDRELKNGETLDFGKDLTQSNKVLAELCKAELEAKKIDAEIEIEKIKVEAEEKRAKRETMQKYVNTGCMVGLGFLALFADSDSFIGRVNSRVLGFVTKVIFKG